MDKPEFGYWLCCLHELQLGLENWKLVDKNVPKDIKDEQHFPLYAIIPNTITCVKIKFTFTAVEAQDVIGTDSIKISLVLLYNFCKFSIVIFSH